jgi:hypothetical protein
MEKLFKDTLSLDEVSFVKEQLKQFKKGALIRWTAPIQALSKIDLNEPDLNKWNVLEKDIDINYSKRRLYLYISGWSIPFSIINACLGFTVIAPTELSEVLYVNED